MIDYIELNFDIFDLPRQQAKVISNLSIADLLEEILKEFNDDLDRESPERYALYLKGHKNPLDVHKTLLELDLHPQDELILKYAGFSGRMELPISDKVFLHEPESNEIFEIKFQPALIGRPDASDPTHNLLLAVNLLSVKNGRYASRQQARITFNKDFFYIESLSDKSLTFLNDLGTPIKQKIKIVHGDQIIIGKNRVILNFNRIPKE